jgi:hypothetical protein
VQGGWKKKIFLINGSLIFELQEPESMNWDEFLSNENALNLIRKAVFKSIPENQDLAAEAVSYVAEEILKDNKRRLQDYRTVIDPENYLYFVIRRIMRDFWISKKGRFRCPPSLLKQKKAGFLKVLIYKMLCWQQLPTEFIIERLTDAGKNSEDIKRLIEEIRTAYQNCQKPIKSEISIEDISSVPSNKQNDSIPFHWPIVTEEPLIEKVMVNDLHYFFNYILRGVPEKIPVGRIISAKVRKQMVKARQKFRASNEECRFFRLIHLTEMSVSAAGRMFGWRKDVAQGKSRRLWKKFCRVIPKELLEEFDPCPINRKAKTLPNEAKDDPSYV